MFSNEVFQTTSRNWFKYSFSKITNVADIFLDNIKEHLQWKFNFSDTVFQKSLTLLIIINRVLNFLIIKKHLQQKFNFAL